MRASDSFSEGGAFRGLFSAQILVVWRRKTAHKHKNSLQSRQSTKACQILRSISVVPTSGNFLFTQGKLVDETLTNVPFLQVSPELD